MTQKKHEYPNYPMDHPCPQEKRITDLEEKTDELEDMDHKLAIIVEGLVNQWIIIKWLLGMLLVFVGAIIVELFIII